MARRKSQIFSNKKASIVSFVIITVLILVFAVGTLLAFKLSDTINQEFQSSSDITTEGKEAMQSVTNMYPGIVNNSFLFFTVGVAIVAFIMAALVRVHPVFIALFIILLAIIIFLAAVFSNIYQEMAEEPEFIDLANQLNFINFIMHGLPFIVGIFGSLLAVIMYRSWQGGGF